VKPLRVTVAPSVVRLEWTPPRGVPQHLALAWPTPEALRAVLAGVSALDSRPGHEAVADVVLDDHVLQHRTLRGLPPVRAQALQEIVALHQGQYFRRNGHPLVTAARWNALADRDGETTAMAVAIDVELLEAIEQGLSAAGVRVRAIRCGRSGLCLQSPSRLQRTNNRRRNWRLALLLVNVMVWSTAAGVHVGRLVAADRRLRSELATLAPAATAIHEARRALAVAAAQVDSVRVSEQRRDRIAAQVAQLASALPDSAYLATLALDQRGDGFLTGSARPATALLAALERAGWPTGVKLEGEPTPDGARGWERFTVRLGHKGTHDGT